MQNSQTHNQISKQVRQIDLALFSTLIYMTWRNSTDIGHKNKQKTTVWPRISAHWLKKPQNFVWQTERSRPGFRKGARLTTQVQACGQNCSHAQLQSHPSKTPNKRSSIYIPPRHNLHPWGPAYRITNLVSSAGSRWCVGCRAQNSCGLT